MPPPRRGCANVCVNGTVGIVEYRRITPITTVDAFREYLDELGLDLDVDAEIDTEGPLGSSHTVAGREVGNRFAALPMEGWDCMTDGTPGELTVRRWARIGAGGAKLIWGGEATAVRQDGRASGNQLLLNTETVDHVAGLRATLLEAHETSCGQTDDVLMGLQLTHSGRYSRPTGDAAPLVAYNHPVLDGRFAEPVRVLSDDDLDELVEDFVVAAELAEQAGFDFVDVKHCHGYLAHELLSAHRRDGRYGGSFENRTSFLRQVVQGIRTRTGLAIGVRLSLADMRPFESGTDGTGQPVETALPYWSAFGSAPDGLGFDFTETHRFVDLLESLNIGLLCATVGSPYYNPHIQRPAAFPPSDGYQPPEDPLRGVFRQIDAVRQIKAMHPSMTVVGSGYSYLQQWLPNVAQAEVRAGRADFVGLGRMILSYPDLPKTVLAGEKLTSKRICRTFSDCTTAPRHGMVSGCYPLDDFYKAMPEAKTIRTIRKNMKRAPK